MFVSHWLNCLGGRQEELLYILSRDENMFCHRAGSESQVGREKFAAHTRKLSSRFRRQIGPAKTVIKIENLEAVFMYKFG